MVPHTSDRVPSLSNFLSGAREFVWRNSNLRCAQHWSLAHHGGKSRVLDLCPDDIYQRCLPIYRTYCVQFNGQKQSLTMLQYLFVTEHEHLTIQGMTTGWILPIFPGKLHPMPSSSRLVELTSSQVMLSGTFASLIAASQPQHHRMAIIVAGVCLKGLGWMISLMIYSIYMLRLIQNGLPAPDRRPGGFIAVGPPSFTALALIGLSQALPEDSLYFIQRAGMTDVIRTMAEFVGIFLWGLSAWFFCVTLLSILVGVKRMSFKLNWWAFVFPNVGFTIATIRIGESLQSEAVLWFSSVMTILLVATWLFVLVSHIRAVVQRKIMMPGMDEDKGELLNS